MRFWQNKKKRKIVIISVSIVLVLALLVTACAIYLLDYYPADFAAIEDYLPEGASWQTNKDGSLVFEPQGATKGLIFYPGGKVEHTAYIPLMYACYEAGILCVLIEMPFHLAVFDSDAADGVQEKYPEITEWYIGGHSLGGAMAASYLVDHAKDYEGLLLLAAYATENLSKTDLSVLSIYGSEDKVLDKKDYEGNKKNLPSDFEEVMIEGGNHAYFGMYGKQDGDGATSITQGEQIQLTSDAMIAWILGQRD